MSGKNRQTFVEKEKGDSKAASNKTEDYYKFKKKAEKRMTTVPKIEATSSNHFSSHKSYRNRPNKNTAQNRLKKLRTKLDAEIKLKEKINTVGISRLLDESVVKVEKSQVLPSKQKSPKAVRADTRVNPVNTRNIASERLKKIKKELQDTIKYVQIPASEPIMERDLFMEIDEDMSESVEKISSTTNVQQNVQEITLSHNFDSSNHNDTHFDGVPFINDEIYKIRQEPSYMALHTNLMSDIEMDVDTPDGDMLIVIDTNVFLSHLKIIDYLLKNSSFSSTTLNSCVLVVPWPVIQEIDYAMKKNNERLNSQARFANNFINECLKKKHPRFFGQSLIDFKENFKNAVNIDDFILQYCMKFISFDKKVILLTNDKNLCNKAMINNLSVFTTKEFVSAFNLSKFF